MSSRYILVPRADGPFKYLDLMSRNVFGLIFDRWKLSALPQNVSSFTDGHGTYCVFDRKDMMQELGVTLPTIRKAIKCLVNAGVLDARRVGMGAAWRYYLSDPARQYLDDGYAALVAAREREAAAKAKADYYRMGVVNFDED